ncbi:MAG TPA: PadR family transcriptional regulator [Terriglobales bacterium]|jgi:DNA-binding PadR family transcriptional regulator
MKINDIQHSSLWELAVLSLLHEGPMHPYEMQSLIRLRHKDEVLVLKKGSLYHAIGRLERAGLIEAQETTRNGRRPERTTYKIVPAGEQELLRWLKQLIATPTHEASQFMASLSFLVYLSPEIAAAQMELRVKSLEKEIAGLGTSMEAALPLAVSRINLLETEYLRSMRIAELAWVRSLIQDLQSGALTWDLEKILSSARAQKNQAQEVRS